MGKHILLFLHAVVISKIMVFDINAVLMLTPSQVIRSNSKSNNNNNNQAKVKAKVKNGNSTVTSPSTSNSYIRRKSRTGNVPDIFWRSIPLKHVRHHPSFIPLPPPASIRHLHSVEDVRNFRQESWQWDALHDGRCTTSQAVAALGFLEPQAAEYLGIPKGLRRGGTGAYFRLMKIPKMQSLEEMNSILCVGNNNGNDGKNDNFGNDDDNKVDDGDCNNNNDIYWKKSSPNFPFAAKYTVKIKDDELLQRRNQMLQWIEASPEKIRFSIRMMWGNVQESTSLLTALNYFWKLDNRIIMKEVGMCGASLNLNTKLTGTSGLIVGATPDAILVYPDGKIEAVEVKNHCPFLPNYYSNKKKNGGIDSKKKETATSRKNRFNNRHHLFRLSGQKLLPNNTYHKGEGVVGPTVMPQYIPQLMMEMLCVGEECKSAIMVRQSAMDGALILRIHRDDNWINEMIYWLNRFMLDYVQQGVPPPSNFFLLEEGSNQTEKSTQDRLRFKKFLNFTKKIEQENVELLTHVPNRGVQRAFGESLKSMDLFLD